MELRFGGEVVWWRGPAPHHFVALPEAEAERLRDVAADLTYGWGCIPATVTLGATTFTTSIFPKDGGFLVPLKVAARRAEGVELGDDVDLVVLVGQDRETGPDDDTAVHLAPVRHPPPDTADFYDPAADVDAP